MVPRGAFGLLGFASPPHPAPSPDWEKGEAAAGGLVQDAALAGGCFVQLLAFLVRDGPAYCADVVIHVLGGVSAGYGDADFGMG